MEHGMGIAAVTTARAPTPKRRYGRVNIVDSQDRITLNIEASREELLDLGLRNPLLNYRPSRARGVEVVDELPMEVFRILVRERKSIAFQAAPEISDSEAGEGELLTQPGDEGEDGGLAARHVDLRLQTDVPSTKLQKRLLKTERDASDYVGVG
jgi:hypothetical protein